ncbi:MAG: FG-GAP-like repeat-containing protein [Candidatus Paceibacterota bacterium]|nr:MAG: FG-GAP-like repeat-containing protein [Candidatus Paceibacterota bacterium]
MKVKNSVFARITASLIAVSFLMPTHTLLFIREVRAQQTEETSQEVIPQKESSEPVFSITLGGQSEPSNTEDKQILENKDRSADLGRVGELRKENDDRKIEVSTSEDKIVENPNAINAFLPDVDVLTGAALYKYPIDLPPGRNNIAPDLNLVYNSSLAVNNSFVGYGWSISIPYIERVNRNGAHQFYTNATSTFTSSLSGELVLDSGNTYKSRVEDGSFLNYEFSDNKWIVTDKSGTKYLFGTTTQSRQLNASSTDQIYKWMIEEIRDANSNFVKFNYIRDNNQIYPSSIVYTSHSSNDGIFTVDFIHENREDPVPSYDAGFKVITSKRISNIQIKIDNSLTKEYLLNYTTGYNDNRSLLQSVVASSTIGQLPPTEFEYQTITTNQEFDPDFYQLPSHYRTTEQDYYFWGLREYVQLIDVNGDGLPDYVVAPDMADDDGIIPDNNNLKPRVYLNTGTGWQFDPDFYQLPSHYRTTEQDYYFWGLREYVQLIDVNGDGLPDYVVAPDMADDDGIIPDNNNLKPRVYLNTGTGWQFDPDFYQLPSHYRTTEQDYYFWGLREYVQLIDVNGDGLPDYVVAPDMADDDGIIPDNNNLKPRVYLNTGTGWQFDPDFYQLPSHYRTTEQDYYFWGLREYVQLIDVNGDGLPDYVVAPDMADDDGIIPDNNNLKPRVYLNTGTGWQFDPDFYQLPSHYRTTEQDYYFWGLREYVQLIDVNGDGLPDYVVAPDMADDDGIIPDNNNLKPRVYLNTGTGWQFDPDFYQLPSHYRTTEQDYYFWGLREYVQLIDVNGDGLPDYVVAPDMADDDGIIPDNNNLKPRVYLNTGTGWQFDPDFYQLPSHYRTTEQDYYFWGLREYVQLIDVNGDGLPDYVVAPDMADDDGQIPNNNNLSPRRYSNKGKASDYLSRINMSEGGTVQFDYKLEAIVGPNPRRPFYPQSLYVVKNMGVGDGLGNTATTSYSYFDGEYYYHADQFRQFVGFGRTEKTDPAGNLTKTYFHQGNTTATSTGEYNDHVSKAGRPYRVEQYDNSGNLYAKTINKWDRFDLGNKSSFVKLADTLEFLYDGNSTHREKATSFSYDNSTGNISQRTEWGEVSGNDNGTFTDIGSDKFTTNISYATSTGGPPLFYLPSVETILDQNSNKIRETRRYYDNLSLGNLGKGNGTKTEYWKSDNNYISVEKVYNNFGLVTEEKDPRGKITTYVYDLHNLYPATTTNPLSHITERYYDYSSGKPREIIDPNGNTFQVFYDSFGRIIEEKQPDLDSPGNLVTKTAFSYDDFSFPRSIKRTDYLNSATSSDAYTYLDGLGRVIQERREAEDFNNFSVRDFAYNAIGKIQKESLPYFSTGASSTPATTTSALYIEHSYDALGRVKTIFNALGTTANTYNDWKLTVTDPLNKVKHFYKDAYDNLVKVEEINNANTYTTTYNWNGNRNLTKITDAEGNIRNFTYDGLGRNLTAEDLHNPTDNTFGIWSYDYDPAGNLASSTDPKGQNIIYTYNDLNRRLTENYTVWSGTEVEYGYDSCPNGIGQLCSATTTIMVLSNEYDPLGRVKKETKKIINTNYATQYEYDRQGNLTKLTHPDSSFISYDYNKAGLLEKVAWKEPTSIYPSVLAHDLDYSPLGQVTYLHYGNNASTTNTYDPDKLYRLSNKTTRYNENVWQDLSYTYDAVGNITKIIDSSDTNTAKMIDYAYDDLHRLTSASTTDAVGGNYSEAYTYSNIGNITSKSDQGNYLYEGNQGSNYANPHAVTSIASNTLTYDKNGNLTALGQSSFSWDYRNQLTEISNGATTTTYSYDPQGNRLTYAINNSATTTYITRHYDVKNRKPTKHIYAGDDLIATIETSVLQTGGGGFGGFGSMSEPIDASAKIFYLHPDHLLGTSVVTKSNGGLEELTDYYPYGKIKLDEQASTFKTSKKYTGHTYDEDTDLNYMNARYQDGKVGRFISQDPVFLAVGNSQVIKEKTGLELEQYLSDPQLLNSYSYVKNNPLKHTDSTGEFIDIFLDVGFIGYDLYKIGQDIARTGSVSRENITALGADIAGAALPGVAGLGFAARIGGKADDVNDARKAIERVIDSSKSLRVGDSIGDLGKIVEPTAGKFGGYTPYSAMRSETRGVSHQDVLNTIGNPVAKLEQTSGRSLYLTKETAVVLDNKTNKVITTYSKKQFEPHIIKFLKKYAE